MGISAISNAMSSTSSTQSSAAASAPEKTPAVESGSAGQFTKERANNVPEADPAVSKQEEMFGKADELPMSRERMQKAIDDINKTLTRKSCEFGIDETTNRITIKIIDEETDEVIRELPPEKTLKMIAKAWELAGILVDEKL